MLLKCKVDNHSKEDNNSHQVLECQANSDNIPNNTLVKEVATNREEEEAKEAEEVDSKEVECNLCQWVVSLKDRECHIQDRCNNKSDNPSLNNSKVE